MPIDIAEPVLTKRQTAAASAFVDLVRRPDGVDRDGTKRIFREFLEAAGFSIAEIKLGVSLGTSQMVGSYKPGVEQREVVSDANRYSQCLVEEDTLSPTSWVARTNSLPHLSATHFLEWMYQRAAYGLGFYVDISGHRQEQSGYRYVPFNPDTTKPRCSATEIVTMIVGRMQYHYPTPLITISGLGDLMVETPIFEPYESKVYINDGHWNDSSNECRHHYPDKKTTLKFSHHADHFTKDPVGHHVVCRGKLFLQPSSPSHNVLICKRCLLRIPLPVSITTYGRLRGHFATRFQC